MKYCAFIWDGLGRFLCYRDIWWDTWGSEEVGAPDIWMRRQHCREDDGMCRGPGMGECKWGSWQQLRGEVSGGKWGQGGGQRKCQWDGALVRILALTLNEIGHHWRGLRMEFWYQRGHFDKCLHPAGRWPSSDLSQPSLCPTQSLFVIHQRWLHNLHGLIKKKNVGTCVQRVRRKGIVKGAKIYSLFLPSAAPLWTCHSGLNLPFNVVLSKGTLTFKIISINFTTHLHIVQCQYKCQF